MNPENEKQFVPEEYQGDALERISTIIERVGKDNLEQPEIKKEIEIILENLLNKARLEEKINFEKYKLEMTETIETTRKKFEKEQETFGLSVLKTEKKSEDIAQEQINSLEKLKSEPLVKDYINPEETKVKTLLGKAGGIFKNSSTLRKWAGILSLSILFHGGLFFGLKKIEEKDKQIKAEEIFKTPSVKEIAKIKKTIENEKFKEFNPNYLNWDLQELSELCQKIKYLAERYPESMNKEKVAYVLEGDLEEIDQLFDKIESDFQTQDIFWFENKNALQEVTNEWTTLTQFLDKKIKFEEVSELRLAPYLCLSSTDYVITSKDKTFESYYQLAFTLVDAKNSQIINQFSLKLNPEEIKKDGVAEAIKQEIIEQVRVSLKKKSISKLPSTPVIIESQPRIIVDQEKYQNFSPEEKELFEKGMSLVNDLWIDCIVETPPYYQLISITPEKECLSQGPIKINGKLSSLSFSLPKEYKLLLNGQETELENPQEDKIYYTFDNHWFYKGSIGAVSQEKELIFSILDKDKKEVGRFSFEQIPEWFVENLYYQNVHNQPDSIGIYITDADTLQIYQKWGKEKAIKAIRKFAEGIVDVEKYFNLDLDLQKVRLGSDIEIGNAFYLPLQEKAINLLAPEISRIQEVSPNEKIANLNLLLTGRHESLHKLDALLGQTVEDKYHNLSNADTLEKHFDKLKIEWNGMDDEQKSKHLFYLIKDGNFYHELNQPEAGHPDDNVNEFFVSSLVSAMAEKQKLKIEFQKWPMEVKKQYVETLIMIEKMLHKKNVNTDKLSETIQYLIDLRTEKIK